MSPDLVLKALSTALFVGLLQWGMRRAGPRLGGLVAAIPVSSMPALIWLHLERGGAWAAQASSAALWTTALTALAAVSYVHVTLRLRRPVLAACAVCTGAVLVAAATRGISQYPAVLLLLAPVAIVLARQGLPMLAPAAARRSNWRQDTAVAMAVSGVVTAAVLALAQGGDPVVCGLVSAVPFVAMSTCCVVHRQGGTALVCRFFGGYIDGMGAKAVFLMAFQAGVLLGLGLWAWLGAAAVAVTALVLLQRWPLRPVSLRAAPAPAAADQTSVALAGPLVASASVDPRA